MEGKSAAALVTDSSLAAEMASKTTTALNLVIDKISDDDEPSIGFIYDSMYQIKKHYRRSSETKESDTCHSGN